MPGCRRRRPSALSLALALALALYLGAAACGHVERPMHPPPAGTFYVVRDAARLADIARQQGVPLDDLAEINGIPPESQVVPGQVLFVLAPEAGLVPASSPDILPPSVLDDDPPSSARDERMIWPLAQVTISSAFGRRWGRAHEGIDLAAPQGTPVRAARAGSVLYAGDRLSGYGKMIVLQHDHDLLTAYAHNSVLLVKIGDRVRAGQVIARVGRTGRASAPHLHFEVRRGQIPQDPLKYLPAPGAEP